VVGGGVWGGGLGVMCCCGEVGGWGGGVFWGVGFGWGVG